MSRQRMEQTARVLGYGQSDRPERVRSGRGTPQFAWRVLGWMGLALTAVGTQDLILTLVPLRVGNPEWEFGTVTAMLNGLPVLALGLALLLGWAAGFEKRWLMRTLAVGLLLLAVVILAAFTLYALTIPVALRSIQDPAISFGLKKAILKTAVQAVVYPLVFVVIGITAFRYSPKDS